MSRTDRARLRAMRLHSRARRHEERAERLRFRAERVINAAAADAYWRRIGLMVPR